MTHAQGHKKKASKQESLFEDRRSFFKPDALISADYTFLHFHLIQLHSVLVKIRVLVTH